MVIDRAKTIRGAFAGAVAAGVWAAQQPLDKPLFGAAYATVAPRLPLPSWSRGPIAALAEHLATWPLTIAIDRVHPARGDLEPLAASRRAFAQATWRHLLFGVVLGELERRLNEPEDSDVPSYEHVISSNGHGKLEHAGVMPGTGEPPE
jgi:hypothetical protein